MKRLTAYILGMITVITFVPILESITEVGCSYLEILKTSPMKKILIANNEIADLQAKLEPVSTNCIGFVHNGDNDEDDYEEDKVKNKIGFR